MYVYTVNKSFKRMFLLLQCQLGYTTVKKEYVHTFKCDGIGCKCGVGGVNLPIHYYKVLRIMLITHLYCTVPLMTPPSRSSWRLQ